MVNQVYTIMTTICGSTILVAWIGILLLGVYCPVRLAAPVAKKMKMMIDMTHVFNNDTLVYPTSEPFSFVVLTNGTIQNTKWSQSDEISLPNHIGTHVDAPCHFAKGRWCVNEIPISRLNGPVAVIDVTSQAESNPNYGVNESDLKRWEWDTGDTLNGKIVLMRSGWGKRWGNKKAYIGTNGKDVTKLVYPGMSKEGATWLVKNRNIIAFGTDTLEMDNGASSNYEAGFPSHSILLRTDVYGIENLANMEELPIKGAHLYVSPMLIENASGSTARVFATFEV